MIEFRTTKPLQRSHCPSFFSVRSVDGSAKSNADYVKINPTKLLFKPGQLFKDVTVKILDDKKDEKKNLETFALLLSSTDKRVRIVRGKFQVIIKDNDGKSFMFHSQS